MGGGMAANWLAKGFEVSVWNRTRSKAEPLAAKGAKVAATPRDAAQGADFIFAMVSDDEASRNVWLGPDGGLAGAKSDAIGVESSTLTPDWVRELGRQAHAKGCGFLDAPVGGSRPAAEAGELRFFVGGDPQTYEAARPALAAVGSKMDLLGPLGAGATWKLINNQLGAGQIAALAEALEVAKRAGFKNEQISELILGGPAASPMVKLKLPRMLAQDFEPADFALNLMLKDARYAAALAQSLAAPAGMIEGAAEAFARADAKGLGAKDIAAVVG
jgi:3-hydroxyisobutyrate dehydrogenase